MILKPIDTAPKDGTEIIVYCDGVFTHSYYGKISHVPMYGFLDYYKHEDPEDVSYIKATHWCELPEVPN